MHPPDITVSIVSFNTRELLLRCLRSLQEREEEGEAVLQIIVADNGSTDGTQFEVATTFPRVELFATGANIGYGRANNRAFTRAQAPCFLVLNSDTQVQPGALRKMRDYLEAHPDAGGVGPQLLWPDGRLQTSWGFDPAIRDIVFEQLFLDKLLQRTAPPGGAAPEVATEPRQVEQICGACSFLRAAAYQQVGGFDPAYFMYHEDVDLNIRLRQDGWRLIFLPAARVTHHLGASSEKSWQTRARMIRALNWSRHYYYSHHGGPMQGMLLKALFVAGSLLRLTTWSVLASRPGGRDKVRMFRRVLRGAATMKAISDKHL